MIKKWIFAQMVLRGSNFGHFYGFMAILTPLHCSDHSKIEILAQRAVKWHFKQLLLNTIFASASFAGLPINRSITFSHIQFEFSNSLLCRFADQQVLGIYPLPVPALPVCRSTDQRFFHTYSLNFQISCSADLPINRFWAYTHCQCQLCRSADQ